MLAECKTERLQSLSVSRYSQKLTKFNDLIIAEYVIILDDRPFYQGKNTCYVKLTKNVYRPLVNETILYYMNNVKQLIERLRDKCTAEQLNRTAVLTSIQFDIWQIARKIYVILFDEQKQHDGYVLCRYRLESQSEHKCIGYIEKYFDDVELVGLTYRLSCLDEEISIDALYDSIKTVEHKKFMIIDKLYENVTVAKVKAI